MQNMVFTIYSDRGRFEIKGRKRHERKGAHYHMRDWTGGQTALYTGMTVIK